MNILFSYSLSYCLILSYFIVVDNYLVFKWRTIYSIKIHNRAQASDDEQISLEKSILAAKKCESLLLSPGAGISNESQVVNLF